MNESPKGARVLVAGDNLADVEQVRHALAGEFERVEVSTRPEQAGADFERVLPRVIVLAFDELAKAQHYCLGLLRFSGVAKGHAYRTIILCAKEDLRAVFDLCKKGYFDDYVLYWPQAHDGLRLAMSVWIAMRQQAGSHSPLLARSDIAAHAESAVTLGTVVDRQLDEGMRHVAAAKESLAVAERDVASGPGSGPLQHVLATSRDSLEPIAAWAQGFRAEVAPHVTEVRALAAKLKPGRPIVLIVEDDAFGAKLIAKALEGQGLDLEFAVSAPDALLLLRRILPTVILMDVNLPGMDGLALTEWLKTNPSLSRVPVIMLTGDARRETIERSMAAGAVGFIVKPFTRDNLIAKLARFVR